MIKELYEIDETDWTVYEWVEVTLPGHKRRQFVRGMERTPNEAAKANADYKVWVDFARLDRKRSDDTADQ